MIILSYAHSQVRPCTAFSLARRPALVYIVWKAVTKVQPCFFPFCQFTFSAHGAVGKGLAVASCSSSASLMSRATLCRGEMMSALAEGRRGSLFSPCPFAISIITDTPLSQCLYIFARAESCPTTQVQSHNKQVAVCNDFDHCTERFPTFLRCAAALHCPHHSRLILSMMCPR